MDAEGAGGVRNLERGLLLRLKCFVLSFVRGRYLWYLVYVFQILSNPDQFDAPRAKPFHLLKSIQ